ncbi:tRNA(Ile)-lysidine synthetase [Defluviimonas sp. 20V17]|nr:tRNA(Ile)-lysidine synthetase [Defluviimonas sp. 20V17]
MPRPRVKALAASRQPDGSAAEALAAALAEASATPPARLGVAVSGGGDSLALLHLLHDWAAANGVALSAATVDHGLRAAAAAEAAMVADVCAGLGLPHAVLRWRGWEGRGNLPDAARRARYRLLGDWARGQGLAAVALGHTLDDQAETLLMRLARGSGVDGLSAMAARREAGGMVWLRPLLGVRRGTLRDLLRARGVGWAEDPSNDDPAFDRVKARRALAALAPLGIDAAGLAATAGRMATARAALAHAAHALAQDCVSIEAGDVVIDRPLFEAAPEETRLRLMAHALGFVGSAEYRPRLASLQAALGAALGGRRRTLAGCLIRPRARSLRITREYRAVATLETRPDVLWDGRWRLSGPDSNGLTLRALGPEGLARLPGWRDAGLPRDSLIAAPALWRGPELVAAPLACVDATSPQGWRLWPEKGRQDFLSALLSH